MVSSWIVPSQNKIGKSLEKTLEEDEDNSISESAAALPPYSEWVSVVDDDTGQSYFVEKTGSGSKQNRRSSWVLPEGGVEVAGSSDDEEQDSDPSSDEGDNQEDQLPPNWVRHVDEEERVYYFNTQTEETSWELPAN